RAISSGYCKDPIGFSGATSKHVIDLGGSPHPAPDRTQNVELNGPLNEALTQQEDVDEISNLSAELDFERLEMLRMELQNVIEDSPHQQRFKHQILIESTRDGLRIQIIDSENRLMLALGCLRMEEYFEDILLALTDSVVTVTNKITFSGLTVARQCMSAR